MTRKYFQWCKTLVFHALARFPKILVGKTEKKKPTLKSKLGQGELQASDI